MKRQIKINTMMSLDTFRRFLLYTYGDIPKKYVQDPTIFIERESKALIHVRAKDKCTIQNCLRHGAIEYTIISAIGVLDIFYRSKSGRTKLHWSLVPEYYNIGRVTGTVSPSTLENLSKSEKYHNKNHKHNSRIENTNPSLLNMQRYNMQRYSIQTIQYDKRSRQSSKESVKLTR